MVPQSLENEGMHSSVLPAETTTQIISETVDIVPNTTFSKVTTCRIKLTFGGYWVSLLAGYWERSTTYNYWSKGVAVLGSHVRSSNGGVASILSSACWRVPQSLNKERSVFQCVASADNNLQIIRSETIFSKNEKLSK